MKTTVGRSTLARHIVVAATFAIMFSALPPTAMSAATRTSESVAPPAPAASRPNSVVDDSEIDVLLAGPEFAASDGCADDANAIANATRIRADIGLDASPETVAASETDPAYTCTAFGVPLTRSEMVSFAYVLAAQGDLSSDLPKISEDPTYAGAYFEGSDLTVASTTGTLAPETAPMHGSVSLVKAEYTETELESVADEIASKTALDGSLDVTITRVSVDRKTNRVVVGISEDSKATRAKLGDQFGDKVVVVVRPVEKYNAYCSDTDCGTRGGVSIDHVTPLQGCTSGFLVRAKLGPSGSWGHYMLTAGHCLNSTGRDGDTGHWQNTAGTIVWGHNKVTDFQWVGCGFGNSCLERDLGLYGLGSNAPAVFNTYQIGTSTVAINASNDANTQYIGQVVYRRGRRTGFGVGTITDKPTSIQVSGCGNIWCYQEGVVEVDVASNYGDSGAGFYRYYTSSGVAFRSAYGVLSSGPTPGSSPTYYNPWFEMDDPNFSDTWFPQPCTTSAC